MSSSLNAQTALYKCDQFTVYSDHVEQGDFRAEALSPTGLKSNYESPFKAKTDRRLQFKFSINGEDNERGFAEDHYLVLVPQNGTMVSPVYTFAQPDPETEIPEPLGTKLDEDIAVTIRLDMSPVFDAFETQGYFELFNGQKLLKDDFQGVYIAGGTAPLSWEFNKLPERPEMQLTDPDHDQIFEVTINFSKEYLPDSAAVRPEWTLSKDISDFPRYESDQVLIDALYNLSLEEMLLDIREDGAFMAGEKWTGVWTRDISYSILLSLAMIHPKASRISLMAKVKDGQIIQDTGTGGSWPVSSDRVTWALAAWELYQVTGDPDWLRDAFNIIKNSVDQDLQVVYNPPTGLFFGESSFLDWREQTYPAWMEPMDIFHSQNLGTVAVHYQTYRILVEMAILLGEPIEPYLGCMDKLEQAINNYLWLPDKGYFGQYLYGRTYPTISPRAEILGEALTVLFGIAGERQERIIAQTPVTPYGPACIYPQIPDQPPYHNDGIWPFVVAYWTWAAAKTGHVPAVEHGLGSIYRAAGLFLTNKENLVAQTGDYLGTQINSNRQLWSVAGNLAMVYRILFGMQFETNGLSFHPVVPKAYAGSRTLANFPYRDAVLNITIAGFGEAPQEILLDGSPVQIIPTDLTGEHEVKIVMNGTVNEKDFRLVTNAYSPATPEVTLADQRLHWQAIGRANHYAIFQNGRKIAITPGTHFDLPDLDKYAEYQVMAVDENGWESFLSEPLPVSPEEMIRVIPLSAELRLESEHDGFAGNGYLTLALNRNKQVTFPVDIDRAGIYTVDARYANGNGSVTTDNKCALRSLHLDGQRVGSLVMPQRGDSWTDWGYSSRIVLELTEGAHEFTLSLTGADTNMNGTVNTALLNHLRLIRLGK